MKRYNYQLTEYMKIYELMSVQEQLHERGDKLNVDYRVKSDPSNTSNYAIFTLGIHCEEEEKEGSKDSFEKIQEGKRARQKRITKGE